MNARRDRILIAAAVLTLTGGGAGCSKEKGVAGGGFSMPPTPVETAAVTRGPVIERFDAVGTVEAGDAITVVSEIAAAVVSLPFREGDPVQRGALIARLDDSQLAAELARAEAVRDQRQSAYDRIKAVVDEGAGAPQDLDDGAAALKVAEADLALARARLAKTRITAPFGGILGARRVSPGAFLRAGDAITDLARIDELRIKFAAPERYLSKLHRGAPVTVSTTAYPDHPLTGAIDVIEPVLDPRTRNASIVARVQNPEGLFRPGMSADVTAILAQRDRALTIPSEAVFAEGNQILVYVVREDSTVARTLLTLGTRLPDVVEVLGGLEEGARVVRAGHQKLFEGAKVMPVEAAGGAQGEAAGSADEGGTAP
jgi:membrane fusion protein (multidrug efflux system)